MKKLLFVFCLSLVAAFNGYAQQISKKDVPAPIIKSYLSQNSKGVQDSVWSKEVIAIYKVNYMDDGKPYEAQYFEDGRWIKTFTEITQSELHPAIAAQLTQHYPNYKIEKSFIELNNDGKFYAVDLARGKDKLYVYFQMSGKMVR